MTKLFAFITLVLFCLIAFLCYGCCPETGFDNTSPPTSTSTENGSLYWMEVQGRFATNDLVRAQAEIPFKIVLPTYIPDSRVDIPLPHIEGPLCISSNDNDIEVIIRYLLYLGDDIPSQIFITESNSHISLGDPELNPQLELIEIDGKSVIKTRDDWGSGYTAYFSLSSDNIYFIVETLYLPTEEAMKVVKSLIQIAD